MKANDLQGTIGGLMARGRGMLAADRQATKLLFVPAYWNHPSFFELARDTALTATASSSRAVGHGLQRRRHSTGGRALYACGVLLTPTLGAVLMSPGTVIVAVNARLLRLSK